MKAQADLSTNKRAVSQARVRARAKANERKWGRRFLVGFPAAIVLLITAAWWVPAGIGFVAWPVVTGQGDRIGQVVRVSQKGIFWKTWEGSLGLTQSGAYVEKWNFSIDPTEENATELLSKLQQAADDGSIIKVSYKQHVGVRSWNGKTSYIIDNVTILEQGGYRQKSTL